LTRPAHGEAEVTDAQARKTALIVAGVLFLIAAWNIYRGRMTVVAVLGSIGGALILIGLVPAAARTFHRFWMRVAEVLGYINSRILLSLLYYLVFTPYGVISRLIGRDALGRRGPEKETYWLMREHTRQSKEQFERLF
jgi:Saxitoxin biosynthesis operon protein SxtJ